MCEVRDLQEMTRMLVPSNPDFRRTGWSGQRSRDVQLLDGACSALMSRGVYDVLGIDESFVRQILSTPSVSGMWANTQRMALSVSFFKYVDRQTASKVATARHALALYAQVMKLGGVDYQMAAPEKLAFVHVLRYFVRRWATTNRRAIKSFESRRRRRVPRTNTHSTFHLVLPPVSARREFFRFN